MHYDLIIVGGGLVGAGLACALGESNLNIALLDARGIENNDPRLFALSETTCEFLKNIKLWPKLAPHAAPIKSVQVSWQKRFGVLRLNSDEVHLPELGNVIPAHYLEHAFNEILPTLKNVTLYKPAKLINIATQTELASLTIETDSGQKQLTTTIVLAADGTQSIVRQQLNIETQTVDYAQTAIVTRTLIKQPHHNVAYERFTSHGAIAMLPLIGNECATIWSLENGNAHKLMTCSDEEFLQQLQFAFGSRLGKLQKISKRYSFPLRMVKAKNSVHKNVFLLGNAAHTLHPIAAQGFNLALYEVAMLAEVLLAKTKSDEEINLQSLQEVADKIRHQQRTSITISHRLPQLFAKNTFVSSLIFPLGFAGLNIIPTLKNTLLQQLLGKRGRVPRLLLKNEL